ncbi:MAG TPA: hypothetical protein PK883_07205 [Anaerolineaceae bacterium]|nr:hypothetical protein [Anaerolineaceae bacterium]
MAEDLEQKVAETKEEGKKKFMEVAEFRMLVYVIPVGLILLVLALILGK